MDLGLVAIVNAESENGKYRVPTLRNVELTAPYGHNGYFKTLEEIVHFYNVRDVSDEFPPAEYPAPVNKNELRPLGLTQKVKADIEASVPVCRVRPHHRLWFQQNFIDIPF